MAGGEGRIWLVRHGRTAWNGDRYLGRADVALDATGGAQARAAGRVLAAEPVDEVWTSPQRRAHDTAAAIVAARTGAPPRLVVRAELCELDLGEWEGRPRGRLKLGRRDPEVPLPGGESVAQGSRRVSGPAAELREALGRGLRVVVVGHYFTGRLLYAALRGLPVARALHDPTYCPEPGSVSEVTAAVRSATAPRSRT